MKTLFAATLCLLYPMFALADAVPGPAGIVIDDAWIAEAPPVSKVNAAYMKISNNSADEIRIEAISCENYSSAGFHRTVYTDGIASMHHLDELNIPAGSQLVLEPGGYHVMLFNPVAVLHNGDDSGCRVKLNDGRSIAFRLIVKKSSEDHSHHHH